MGQHGQCDAARYDHVLSLTVVWKAVLLQNTYSIRKILKGIAGPPDALHHALVDKRMHIIFTFLRLCVRAIKLFLRQVY